MGPLVVAALFAAGSARIAEEMLQELAKAKVKASWVETGTPDPSDSVKLMMVLKRDEEKLKKLEEKFWAVSDPTSSDYGNHLSADELTDMIGIEDDHINAVVDFFESQGAKVDVGQHMDLVSIEMPISKAETTFSTTLVKYRHKEKGTTLVRAKDGVGSSIPAEMADMISLVDNIEGFPALRTSPIVEKTDTKSTAEATIPDAYDCNGRCPNLVTPMVLQDRYKLGDPVKGKTYGTVAVAEFQGVYWSQNQLNYFNEFCDVNATIDVQMGDNDPSVCDSSYEGNDCTEALLDIEYLRAVTGEIPTYDTYQDDYSLFYWAKSINDMSNPPLVNSVSYGNDEIQQPSKTYMKECNVEFQKLGARGLSVLFASGDQGVWGRTGIGSKYHPDFPAGSPYVTAVGGTDFATAGVIGEEKAWNNGGGGFSDYFDIPSYQADDVAKYLEMDGLPSSSKFNKKGRGYPDVAALAGTQNAYCVVTTNMVAGVGGTSAACPVFAAVIAKLNELRLKDGGSALGFLNPWLYQNPDMFFDVTKGQNGGAMSSSGFPATEGWDASTGLGTPNFEIMKTKI